MEQQNNVKKKDKLAIFKNLKWYEHIAAGWPLILMFVGGAIGGGCGGAAYVINAKIFNSKVATPLKYLFAFLVGVGAVVLSVLLVVVLIMIFPALASK